jgi:hypothetical protein
MPCRVLRLGFAAQVVPLHFAYAHAESGCWRHRLEDMYSAEGQSALTKSASGS